jgi:hypothetical protein
MTAARCKQAPSSPGVYGVVRESADAPSFLPTNPGGRFKGRDPSVAVSLLEARWIPGAQVVYIGQAGGAGSSATLRKRLDQYMRFGGGAPVGHWGGRFIWQLADHSSLQICWLATPERDARTVESELLEEFHATYGTLPFANLQR